MILILKNSNQNIYFLSLKFTLSSLLIKHFDIDIFNFNVVENCVIFSSKIFSTIQYSLLLFLPFFHYLSKSVIFFCVHSDIIKNLIRVNSLKDINPNSTYNTFISKDCNERLSRIK